MFMLVQWALGGKLLDTVFDSIFSLAIDRRVLRYMI